MVTGLRSRGIILLFLALSLFLWLIAVCGELQWNATPESEEAPRRILYTETIPASRGEIFDRNGVPLVQNRTVYRLCFRYLGWRRDQAAERIRDALDLLRRHDIGYRDSMPLTCSAPWRYTCDAEDADARRMARVLRHYGLAEDSSAEEAFDALCEACRIPEDWSISAKRQVLGVCYDMVIRDFSEKTPFVLAENVDMALIAQVAEQAAHNSCLVVETGYIREYATSYAAHILGRTGTVPAEEAEDYAAAGYAANAIVGRDGAERAFEALLRGQDGQRLVEMSEDGTMLSPVQESPARSGGDVYLTLDLRLQEAAEDALALRIRELREQGIAAEGGAAVVLRVDSGEVLAMASYPTYSLTNFSADYALLREDPLSPLYNRAIMGRYAPGSTFKPITALAALTENHLTTQDTLPCEGIYQAYAPQYLYRCWIYRDRGEVHGSLTAAEALQESCNCFFYEAGRLCGITTLSEWAAAFGLGSPTGIELAGESGGVIAGPEHRDGDWYAGDTLQAAIGQSDHLYTPLQLASYMAALANGGSVYRTHLLHQVVAPDGHIRYREYGELRNKVAISDEIYDTIKQGMLAVTEDGTASTVFSDYHISVMGKSGSAQVSAGQANGLFILAAPADAPEIAVAVVIEHGASGNNAARVARDILTAYFGEAISADASMPKEQE